MISNKRMNWQRQSSCASLRWKEKFAISNITGTFQLLTDTVGKLSPQNIEKTEQYVNNLRSDMKVQHSNLYSVF